MSLHLPQYIPLLRRAVPGALNLEGLVWYHKVDGVSVDKIPDLSGNGRDWVQATPANQGSLTTLNGEPAMALGSGDFMTIPDEDALEVGQGSFLYLAVGTIQSPTGFRVWAGKSSGADASNVRFFIDSAQDPGVFWGNDSQAYSRVGIPGIAPSNLQVIGWGFDADAGEHLVISRNTLYRIPVTVAGVGSNGLDWRLGADAGGFYPCQLTMAEDAMYIRGSNPISTAEVNSAIADLQNRYGIVWTPADAAVPPSSWYEGADEDFATDLSLNGRNLAGVSPTYVAAAPNGAKVARFNGTSQYLRATFTLNQPAFLIAAAVLSRGGSTNKTLFDGATAVNTGRIGSVVSGVSSPDPTIFLNCGTANLYPDGVGGSAKDLTEWRRFEAFQSGASSTFLITGTGGGSAGGNAGTNNPGGITVGATGVASPSQFADADIAIAIQFASQPNATDLAKLRDYINNKYGV